MAYSKINNNLANTASNIQRNIVLKMTNLCENYNYHFINIPILESTDLYTKLIGKNTDIISKELYNFHDKDNNDVSLRPEGTSGIIKAYLQNKLYLNNKVFKFFYHGSMFRFENVDKDRFREFQQFGVELINSNDYIYDVEIISLAYNLIHSLGLSDIKVYINNLGSKKDKELYEKVLKKYFKSHLNELCVDCQNRYRDNPIRILDCKSDKRKDFVINAPNINNYINGNAKKRFNKVIDELKRLNINYEINNNLVRGLNYYTDTVFEIKLENINGKRITICGGGRYNSSIFVNDKHIPAIGFAIGIERLILLLEEKNLIKDNEKIMDYNIKFKDIKLLNHLRNSGFKSDYYSNEQSKYTLYKTKEKYILEDNINLTKNILSYDDLLKKITKN